MSFITINGNKITKELKKEYSSREEWKSVKNF